MGRFPTGEPKLDDKAALLIGSRSGNGRGMPSRQRLAVPRWPFKHWAVAVRGAADHQQVRPFGAFNGSRR